MTNNEYALLLIVTLFSVACVLYAARAVIRGLLAEQADEEAQPPCRCEERLPPPPRVPSDIRDLVVAAERDAWADRKARPETAKTVRVPEPSTVNWGTRVAGGGAGSGRLYSYAGGGGSCVQVFTVAQGSGGATLTRLPTYDVPLKADGSLDG